MAVKISKVEGPSWNERIRILRVTNRLSQREAAEAFGVNRRTFIRWEQGVNMPPEGSKHRIAKFFGKRVNEIWY